jgi:DNA-binding response OmpR family regulator
MANHHVLVVEDEWLIARDYLAVLRAAGHVAVGPAATVEKALVLLDNERVDIALLDFQLGASTSAPIAARLSQLGIPFVLVTGHAGRGLPSEYTGGTVLAKPASPPKLIALIEALASQHLE